MSKDTMILEWVNRAVHAICVPMKLPLREARFVLVKSRQMYWNSARLLISFRASFSILTYVLSNDVHLD